MELIVEGRGTFLGKHQGRLRVTREQKTVTEVPLIHLDQVIIVSTGVAISSDVIRVCSEEGIPIHFLEWPGQSSRQPLFSGPDRNRFHPPCATARLRKRTGRARSQSLRLRQAGEPGEPAALHGKVSQRNRPVAARGTDAGRS